MYALEISKDMVWNQEFRRHGWATLITAGVLLRQFIKHFMKFHLLLPNVLVK